jgi:hypothetical protein
LGIKINPLEDSLVSANKTPLAVLGWVTVKIELPGKSVVHPVVIAQQLGHQCLLGADFKALLGVIVDNKTETWYWKDVPNVCYPFFKNEQKQNSVNVVESLNPIIQEKLAAALLTEEQRKVFGETLAEFPSVFASEPGLTNLLEHHVDTGDHQPVSTSPYYLPPVKRTALDVILDDMLRRGQIVPHSGPWAAPTIVRKKKDGGWRMIIDYRKLNEITKKDKYPLNRIDELLDALGQPKFVTVFDLQSGYWQVKLSGSSQEKAAFMTPRGLFKPTVMMFGMCNSGATFSRLINHLFMDLRKDGVVAYLDDIIIASSDFDSHVRTVREVLSRLQKANLTVNSNKVQICLSETNVLGHIISQSGIRPDPVKIDVVTNYPRPRTVKQVRQFLGLSSWYRRFIRGYAQIAEPLNRLLDKGGRLAWTEACDAAFKKLKELVTSSPVMAAPDFSLPFVIQTDASAVGVGAVLLQEKDGKYVTIMYASRALSKQERKYSAVERECLAIVWAIEKMRPYVECSTFKVMTDQKSLQWLKTARDPTGRLTRWAMRLQHFDFSVVYHREGSIWWQTPCHVSLKCLLQWLALSYMRLKHLHWSS